MKRELAQEHINDCKDENGSLDENELIDLIQWAYEQGWAEGIEQYREESNKWKEDY